MPADSERYFLPWRPIPVSPIGSGFFSARGVSIVASEMRGVWLPALLLAAVPVVARAFARGR